MNKDREACGNTSRASLTVEPPTDFHGTWT